MQKLNDYISRLDNENDELTGSLDKKNEMIKQLQLKFTEFELNEVKLTERLGNALEQLMESEQRVLELQ